MKLTGAQALMRVLKDEGVDTIFGFPGGAVIDIYDELDKTKIKHVLVRHEQGAVHAADGYARAKGTVGVCLVTSGPGATNTVTGIASAFMDSIPLVVITGQVPTHLIGNDAFQEVDIVGITMPCTKHNYLVKKPEDLPRIVKEAFFLAQSGRPGPVLIDIPKDVSNTLFEYNAPKAVKLKSYNPTYKPNMKQLKKVIELVKEAQRPAYFCRRWRYSFQSLRGFDPFRPSSPNTGDNLLNGTGCVSRVRSLMAWHDRHARHLPGQHVDGCL